MAGRRASMQLLRVLQQSSGSVRPAAAMQRETTPLRAAVATLSQRQTGGFERGLYSCSFSTRGLHSETQAANDGEETHEYENEKMTAEGGGSLHQNFKEASSGKVNSTANSASDKVDEVKEKTEEKVDEVKEKTKDSVSEAGEKASSVTDTAKSQASKEADTAKDMVKDLPQKVSETATGLKEVGIEAAKAVKRDAEKVAEKVGLKTE